jgi:4-carboxymuconolactone decarboxylase
VITDELYERGLAIRHEMFGAEGAEAQVESTTEFTDKLQEIVTRNCTASRILGDDLTMED